MLDSQFLKVSPNHSVSLSVQGLSVEVGKVASTNNETGTIDVEKGNETINQKILNDISFELESGKLMAIMGGSGSGKTTLLNVLSQRTVHSTKGLQFSGNINFLNSQGDRLSEVKNAYMLQDDFFLPGLTVWETLNFQADLRLPKHADKLEKTQLIESLLEVLELQSTRDTIINSFTMESSLSGGEKRRVSLAIQLLAKPAILFLDEPTTGLDTTSSLKLVQILRRLASPEFGVTIILSIHQPRPQISYIFDKICLLTRGGRLVYYGSLVDSKNYFQKIDFLRNSGSNSNSYSLDYIMSLSVKDTTSAEVEKESIDRINKLVTYWKNENPSNFQRLSPKEELKRFNQNLKSFSARKDERIPFWTELCILTRRVFLLTIRDLGSTLSLNIGAAFIAAVLGWMFYKPAHDLAGIRTLTSALYITLEVIGFQPMFLEIERLWAYDMVFFYREYRENVVSVPGFLISRRLGKFLLEDLPIPLIFSIITYFMFGFRTGSEGDGSTAGHFFVYFAVTLLVQLIGMSTAILATVFSTSYANANVAINIFYQIQNSACGYFVNAKEMPVYVRWTKYLAYFWYAFGANTSNQFTNWMGDCNGSETECFQYSGNYQLNVLGYPKNWRTVPCVILFCWFIGFQIFAAFAIRTKNLNVKMSKKKSNKLGGEDEEDVEKTNLENLKLNETTLTPNMITDSKFEDDVHITLSNICLDVMIGTKIFFFGKKTPKTLLNNISAQFEANAVNAIMGPSGSGKTTLLNFLSNRLNGKSNFVRSGSIKISGMEVAPEELAKISGYVTQHDTTLLSHLTVRETLFYQARLRLPPDEHPRIPNIIHSIIRRTGLVDCADTLIGSEYKKGISGGEKRRVSIAIQLLSRPKILFLDEPTSGLDSSTAASILELLQELAVENSTTIITTIHQPSEEIFLSFSNILLLARGGRVVFNGPSANIRSYFANIGLICPSDQNIADYMLDSISRGVDEDIEESQNRIMGLVENWNNYEKPALKESSRIIDIKKYYKKRLPFIRSLPVIVSRSFKTLFRSGDFISMYSQLILLGIVHALYFSPLKNSQAGLANRLGLIQNITNLYFAGLAINVSIFPIERDLFFQEHADGIYGTFTFSAMYWLHEMPFEILSCLYFGAMIVFVIGLPRNPGMFFALSLSSLTCINCGESLGIMINSIFDHLGLATNILSNLMLFAIFMAGTMSLHMPVFFKAINYINPMKYAVGICVKLGFMDQKFYCDEGVTCYLDSGDAVLDYYNFNIGLPGYFGGLITCLVVYRLIGVLLLYYKANYRK